MNIASTNDRRVALMIVQRSPARRSAAAFRVVRSSRFLPAVGRRRAAATPRGACHPKVDNPSLREVNPDVEIRCSVCGDPAEHLKKSFQKKQNRFHRLTSAPAMAEHRR